MQGWKSPVEYTEGWHVSLIDRTEPRLKSGEKEETNNKNRYAQKYR